MSDVAEISKALNNLLKISVKKLDKLSLVNILIIFAVFLFVTISDVWDGILQLLYVLGDIIGQLFLNKTVHQNIDTTPMWEYFGILMLSLVFCTILVNRNSKNKLW
jgi:hypothetical protein